MTLKTDKNRNYRALLRVHNLPKLPKKERERLVNWLRNVTKEIKKEDPKIFANPTRFRLMK